MAYISGKKKRRLITPEDYEPLVGAENVERILSKARNLRGRHVVHVSSTLYGGGVAELLSSLTILLNGAGVQTGWRVIQGRPDFFTITKKFHNALQGGDINLSEQKLEIYEDVIEENAIRTHLDQDFVVVHDPQRLCQSKSA
jgi:trehalose synthase